MCGIAAIYAYHYASPDADTDELRVITERMASRGPDGQGHWASADHRTALGHRRLAVIDLSDRASQPMSTPDGRYTIVFNGEIYNYRALREQLRADGVSFGSDSDTEVLLRLFELEGERMLPRLRGMFAFAVWDDRLKRLTLARDPLGIKPLYYADDGWCFRTASSARALLCAGRVSRAEDPAAAAAFFLTGSLPDPYTIHQHVRSLPAGTWMSVGPEGVRAPRAHFDLPALLSSASPAEGTRDSIRSLVGDSLLESVRDHLVADVPVGLFLSAGVDSAALLQLARKAGASDLRAITVTFSEFETRPDDEGPLARRLANLYGIRHMSYRVGREAFRADLDKFLSHMEQPTIDGINTYLISRIAHENGFKVALSGLGADELFGGYPSFRDVPRWVRWLRPFGWLPGSGWLWRTVVGSLLPDGVSPKAAALAQYGHTYAGAYFLRRGLFMPWELDEIIGPAAAREGLDRLGWVERIERTLSAGPADPQLKVTLLEASYYLRHQLLRDADWAGMAHSVEIRTPYVDSFLYEKVRGALLSWPDRPGKSLLTESLPEPLPEETVKRVKTGFRVPIEEWLETEPGLQEWRSVPALASRGCHWSRRWAYVVYRRWKQAA